MEENGKIYGLLSMSTGMTYIGKMTEEKDDRGRTKFTDLLPAIVRFSQDGSATLLFNSNPIMVKDPKVLQEQPKFVDLNDYYLLEEKDLPEEITSKYKETISGIILPPTPTIVTP